MVPGLGRCVLHERTLSLVPAGKPGEGRSAVPLALAGPPSPQSIDWESPPQGASRAAVTKAEAPKFFILPLLPDQTPHRDVHCHVTKKLERTMGLSGPRVLLLGLSERCDCSQNL